MQVAIYCIRMSDSMTHVRMTPKLKKRVREYIKRVEGRTQIKINFSEAVRSLMEISLELDEKDE